MRRTTFLTLLAFLLLAGGVVCLMQKARVLALGGDSDTSLYAGAALLMLAATSALFALTMLRRSCITLEKRLEKSISRGKLEQVIASDIQAQSLVGAINDVMDFADRSVTESAMKLKEIEIQLKVATGRRQHAEAILYSISDAVLVTDQFDELVLANEAAARIFGFDLEEATRKPMASVIADTTMVQLINDMRQSGSTNGRRIVEHQIKGPGSSPMTFKATLSCVSDRADQPAGVVAVLHDMTKEKEVAEMKNDFVSNVSHELRTPLASIKAYVEMLIDGEADDERTKREFYDIIQSEANRLGRLIDNILNISRIESGLVKVNKQPQSLTVILKEAIEVITPQAKMKKIEIVEQLTPVFYQTQADKDMLYQAVLNLLSNSVKYTPESGRITVQTLVDESKRKVIARISDTGVGIPPKDLPFVFDKFYRAEANNRMAKGTGLGLSLVKHIIETVHHGRIFVESQVNKGSTFGFEIELI
ncbi:MAG TPA: ATP-binding protein [Tepidisphaeraceae bacterium]|nr:ATP-binding protein [Tepidisphaeraceae bacterium]